MSELLEQTPRTSKLTNVYTKVPPNPFAEVPINPFKQTPHNPFAPKENKPHPVETNVFMRLMNKAFAVASMDLKAADGKINQGDENYLVDGIASPMSATTALHSYKQALQLYERVQENLNLSLYYANLLSAHAEIDTIKDKLLYISETINSLKDWMDEVSALASGVPAARKAAQRAPLPGEPEFIGPLQAPPAKKADERILSSLAADNFAQGVEEGIKPFSGYGVTAEKVQKELSSMIIYINKFLLAGQGSNLELLKGSKLNDAQLRTATELALISSWVGTGNTREFIKALSTHFTFEADGSFKSKVEADGSFKSKDASDTKTYSLLDVLNGGEKALEELGAPAIVARHQKRLVASLSAFEGKAQAPPMDKGVSQREFSEALSEYLLNANTSPAEVAVIKGYLTMLNEAADAAAYSSVLGELLADNAIHDRSLFEGLGIDESKGQTLESEKLHVQGALKMYTENAEVKAKLASHEAEAQRIQQDLKAAEERLNALVGKPETVCASLLNQDKTLTDKAVILLTDGGYLKTVKGLVSGDIAANRNTARVRWLETMVALPQLLENGAIVEGNRTEDGKKTYVLSEGAKGTNAFKSLTADQQEALEKALANVEIKPFSLKLTTANTGRLYDGKEGSRPIDYLIQIAVELERMKQESAEQTPAPVQKQTTGARYNPRAHMLHTEPVQE